MFVAGRGSAAPECCGGGMTALRWGEAANFAVWIWRCPVCEAFDVTSCRYDSQRFWVGAMGRAVVAKIDELIADAYDPRG
jgi:uncharacterized membrane-anchored protein